MKRRLLLLNYEFPPLGGGAANATQAIGRALVGLGHEVTVVTSGLTADCGRRLEDGMEIRRLPALRVHADRSSVKEMCAYMVAAGVASPVAAHIQRCDAAIAFFSIPSGAVAGWCHLLTGIPYIVSLRGSDVPGHDVTLDRQHLATQPLRRAVLAGARAIVANSPSLAATSLRADPYPVSVIPNGVDIRRFSPAKAAPAAIGALLRALFVGRVHREKNLGVLIEQLAHCPNVEVLVAGDGAERPALENRARVLGVADRVRWLGWQTKDALPSLYQQADVLVNPSLYEGSPNVVLEAMASALPVIGSDTPGNRSVIVPGHTGLLFPQAQPERLGTILRQLANDRPLAHHLGRNGREIAADQYSWDRTAKSYLELLSASQPPSANL